MYVKTALNWIDEKKKKTFKFCNYEDDVTLKVNMVDVRERVI